MAARATERFTARDHAEVFFGEDGDGEMDGDHKGYSSNPFLF
jgi:hypothetical protein